MDHVEASDVPVWRSTRRGLIAAALGVPVFAVTAVALAQRPGGSAARPLLSPQAPPLGPASGGNLLLNPGFELDGMGTTFTVWVLGVPLAEAADELPPNDELPPDDNEGIPATR